MQLVLADDFAMAAITMYQGEDYHEIIWSRDLKDDEVASLHIFAAAPEYQGKAKPFCGEYGWTNFLYYELGLEPLLAFNPII